MFDFDVDYTEITATCVDGWLVNWDAPDNESSHSMTFKQDEALCWSPQDEDEFIVNSSTIHFLQRMGKMRYVPVLCILTVRPEIPLLNVFILYRLLVRDCICRKAPNLKVL